MKKIIYLSTVALIIAGCGSQSQSHHFVQSDSQRRSINPVQVHYGSKSVEDVKRDLAQQTRSITPQPQKVTSKIQPPPPVKTLSVNHASNTLKVAKITPSLGAENSTSSSKAETVSPRILEKKSKPISEVKIALQQPKSEVVEKNVKKELPPITKVANNLQPPKAENIIHLPTPTLKSSTPSVATIKDYIEEHSKHEERESDKTVVIIKPQTKDNKPKAALKISNARSKIVASGKKLIGTPYLFGGTTRSGFDCSGLVQYVYKKHGISVPRTSRNQFSSLKSVKNPEPGDLVFFRHGNKPVNHVGIYIGDNKMLHAPSTGKKVKIVDITTKYWKKRYAGARQVLGSNLK